VVRRPRRRRGERPLGGGVGVADDPVVVEEDDRVGEVVDRLLAPAAPHGEERVAEDGQHPHGEDGDAERFVVQREEEGDVREREEVDADGHDREADERRERRRLPLGRGDHLEQEVDADRRHRVREPGDTPVEQAAFDHETRERGRGGADGEVPAVERVREFDADDEEVRRRGGAADRRSSVVVVARVRGREVEPRTDRGEAGQQADEVYRRREGRRRRDDLPGRRERPDAARREEADEPRTRPRRLDPPGRRETRETRDAGEREGEGVPDPERVHADHRFAAPIRRAEGVPSVSTRRPYHTV
jgi:hypothetical protein